MKIWNLQPAFSEVWLYQELCLHFHNLPANQYAEPTFPDRKQCYLLSESKLNTHLFKRND